MTTTSAQPSAAQPVGPSRSGRIERLFRGRPDDPAWARPALLGLLVAAGLLYLVDLSRNGWSNEFYTAAVQAGTRSWRAFLFGSVDSSNFITVDKPAGFLWPMELSARIFGLNSWSLLVPQALEGIATVGLLYATVRRWFGPAAGLIAGAVLALTPVATLMFRFDNPDALLVLLLTLAAYSITRAIESGRTRWVLLAGAFLGLGFLVKMLAAFMVLPGFALAYLWAGPPKIWKRIWQLLAGGAAVVVAAGWWVAIVMLTPASDRPYVGGSTDNNILNLAFNYNGLGRLTGSEGAFGGGSGRAGGAISRELERELGGRLPGAGGGGGGFGGGMFGGGTGITRLFQSDMGGQIAWLIPAALIALVVLLWISLRAQRTDRTRAAALAWGGWLLVTGLVFSYMSGIIHPYYTIALAPAIGALVGIGSVRLWQARQNWFALIILAGSLVLTVIWAWFLLDRTPSWLPWLRLVIVVVGALAAALVLAGPSLRSAMGKNHGLLTAAAASLALIAGLGATLAYSIDTTATTQTGAIPSAGPTAAGSFGPGGGGFPGGTKDLPAGVKESALGGAAGGGGLNGQTTTSTAVSKLLESGASGYRWAAATLTSSSAASLELGTNGAPVMAIGGFLGTDPAPTLAEFKVYVAKHDIHYFVSGGMGFGAGGGAAAVPAASGAGTAGSSVSKDASAPAGFAGPGGVGGSSGYGSAITSWVEANFKSETVSGTTVFDLTARKASSGSSSPATTPGTSARPATSPAASARPSSPAGQGSRSSGAVPSGLPSAPGRP